MLYKAAKSIFDFLLSPQAGRLGSRRNAIPLKQKHDLTKLAELPSYPKISLVTPSYNNAAYLPHTLRSILDQSYPNLDYIVIDGGSTDGSCDVIRKVENQLSFWRSQKDDGQADAINVGFAQSSGEIMGYVNSDDILLEGSLDYVARYFLDNPDVDAIYGHRIIVDENGWEIGRWVLPAHSNSVLYWRDFVPQETLFWRRSAWNKIGARVDDTLHFALDWDMILRFIESGARIRRVPRFIGGFRVREGQKTTSMADVYSREAALIYTKYLGYVPTPAKVRAHVLPYLIASRATELAYRFGFLPIRP